MIQEAFFSGSLCYLTVTRGRNKEWDGFKDHIRGIPSKWILKSGKRKYERKYLTSAFSTFSSVQYMLENEVSVQRILPSYENIWLTGYGHLILNTAISVSFGF